MTTALQHLIGEARAAASPLVSWVHEGGRPCPHDQSEVDGQGHTHFSDGCSQPVFRLAGTDHYDYGQRGGPGHAWCRDNCRHGHREKFW